MRVLSARVRHARLNRQTGRVEAIVVLLLRPDEAADHQVVVRTSAPVQAAGAAPLRQRLAASAKLLAAVKADRSGINARAA
ncbi:MAG: hypothetical protein R3D97_12860 [Paracoccaceae bacterium]